MKKTSKLGIVAATLAMALSCTTALGVFAEGTVVKAPEGFSEPVAIDISATNEALNHWQYYIHDTLDEDGNPRGWAYEDPNVHFKVTENGRTGQAMWVDRDAAAGEFQAYSYYFDVLPNQDYVVTAWVKSICETSSDNSVSFLIEQRSDNGTDLSENAKYESLATVTGRVDDWTKTQFSFKTDAACAKISLKIKVLGVGDFYIDDITVQTSTSGTNSDLYKMAGIGKATLNADGSYNENPAEASVLSAANISSDSSDGDGKSLKLEHLDVYKTVFGMLPHGYNYKLSFKYKNTAGGTADRLSIYIDNVSLDGTRKWYADGVSSSAVDEEWQNYEYEFKAVQGQTDVCWMGITAYGGYLIDELSIVGTDDDGNTMQYIVNGSFSGAYVEGYSLFNNFSVAKQTDGTYVFASSSATKDSASGQRGYMRFDTTTLEQGKTYTLSFDYRSGGSGAVLVQYGTYWQDQITLGSCGQHTAASWSSQSFNFVAGAEVTDRGDNSTHIATTIELYGDAGIGWPTYFRNFSIKDAEGNDYVTANKTLVAPEVVLGENIFEWGTFEGDREYKQNDWTFEGKAGIYGLVFDTRFESGKGDTSPNWMVCLEGAEGAPASAITKEFTVAKRTLALGYKYYGGKPENFVVSALFGENQEVFMDENGFIELPEGVTTIKLKFTSEKYFSFKYLNVGQHTHITPAEEDITTVIATCTNAGGKSFECTDCGKTIYLEKTAKLPHTLKHVHVDATCKDGVDMDVCEVCNQEFNKTVLAGNPENHEWEEVIIKQPTCKESGMKEKVCKHCNEKSSPSIIPATGEHNYENGECTVCHEKDPNYNPDSSSTGTEDSGKDSSSVEESGCGSSISGGFAVLGMIAAAAYVAIRRKKD